MTLADVGKPENWGEFWRNVAVGVMVAVLTSLGTGTALIYNMGLEHAQTTDHLTSIDGQISETKRGIADVRTEQENVKRNLAEEHDHVRDVTAAVKAMADDIMAGRAQTRARIDSVEIQTHANAEALAVNKQISSDIKETVTKIGNGIDKHSDDLSAIREAIGRIAAQAPAAGRGH